ncbi:MAG TPA: sigma-70 family RNA polymerase sigma factor [Thermoanaerobaculia bacterium]|nr:sigma-70 family RNA polymerase sigma factor [Thermoanaerobaculia bacterium]
MFEANLSLVDKVIAGVCRRARLQGADAEDFASAARLALIENDYAILRRYEGRAALGTYLTIVIERLLADLRVQERGRWHPSAEATRMGAAAILLETLIHRDHRTLDEALPLVRNVDATLTRADVEAMLARLPRRRVRPGTVDTDEATLERLVAREMTDAPLLDAEAREVSRRAGEVVRKAIDAFDPEERALLRLRFVSALSIADISRMTRLPQRPLYRRFDDMFARLRRALRQAGVTSQDAGDVLATAQHVDLDLGLEKDENGRTTVDDEPAAREAK